MGMTRQVTESFVSPKITALTSCGATDVSKEFPLHPRWIAAFGLKSVFHNHIAEDRRPVALQLLRRAQMGLQEYQIGCQELAEFVAQGDHSAWDEYFSTLYHFEATIAQAYQAYEYARKALKQDFFKANDGSALQRLNEINNRVKHALAETDQPVWLQNDGLACDVCVLPFGELEDLLRSNARIAEKIVSGELSPQSVERVGGS